MKRLISWLLALTLIVGLLPMSVFATEPDVDIDGSWDEDVDFGELQIHDVEWTWNDAQTEATASVTVPAGATYSYQYYGDNTMVMTVDGVEFEYTPAASRYEPNTFSLTNDGTEEHTYALTLSYAAGTQMNPVELVIGDNEATVEAGNTQGYYFTYTAAGDDVLKLTFSTEAAGWSYVVNNLTTYVYGDTQWSAYADPAEGEEATPVVNPAVIEVAAGDELQIIVNTYDITDEFNTPAGTVIVNAEIVAGSESNPIDLTNDIVNEEDFAATVSVAAGETVYYMSYGLSGMLMSINGGEAVAVTGNPRVAYTWSITNDSETDAEYEISCVWPLGNSANPAVLVIGDNVASIEAGNSQGYYYTWTAEEDGTLSITMPEGDWTYTINNETAGTYGDTQWSDSDPVVNPGSVEVTAGDKIQIIVNTYDPADMWNNPAADLTITADFEAAVKCDHDSIANGGKCEICGLFKLTAATMDLKSALGMKFAFNPSYTGDGAYAVISKTVVGGEIRSINIPKDQWGKSGSMAVVQIGGLSAKEMADDITVVIYNANDEPISIPWVDSARAYVMRNIDKEVWDKNKDAEMKTLAVAMLNYGAAAQVEFNYNTEDLANNQLTEAHQAMAPAHAVPENLLDKGNNTYYLGSNLVLKDKIDMQIAFKTDALDVYAVVKYTDHNGNVVNSTVELENVNAAGTTKKVVIDTLAVADGATLVTVELYKRDGTHLNTIVDSVNGYLARKLAEKDLYQAIADFSAAAYAYFHA